ncbi:hypothetical protein HKD24_09195 [Gluconobacter sp. LMG 31484]|uniref:Uncharacterized protein n=1 Tax=Gluconobacter vitians TaxID=2728102 RepID=A0ABR9Y628_9PROT|nr:hypothetical protein [Gluconobacter vitians]MBF0859388.1 hypothetical protein [Gluconobacter vitians]
MSKTVDRGMSVAEFRSRVGHAVIARRKAFKTLALEALKRSSEQDFLMDFPGHCHTETALFDAFRAMRAEIRAHEILRMAIALEESGLSDHDIFLLLAQEK